MTSEPDSLSPGFLYRRRVEFSDTDTAQLIHFTALLRYMEEAEHAFYRSLGIAGYEWRPDGVTGIPRVSVRCEYLAPLRYAEEVEVRLLVKEVRTKAIRYEADFVVARPDGDSTVAKGEMTVVYATRQHGSLDWAGAPIPTEMKNAIAVAGGLVVGDGGV